MKELNFNGEKSYLQAKKRVKEIKGFYVHLLVSVLSSILIVLVNLQVVPGYHFFWFALGGLAIPQLIHAIIVFGFPKFGLGIDWEQRKIQDLMERHEKKRSDTKSRVVMETNYQDEHRYLKAKNQVDKIKGFYAGIIGYCFVIPFLIFINLSTFSQFHWFWFPAFGWGIGLMFQGMDAFKYNPFLLNGWEEKKIKQFMEQEQKHNNSK